MEVTAKLNVSLLTKWLKPVLLTSREHFRMTRAKGTVGKLVHEERATCPHQRHKITFVC